MEAASGDNLNAFAGEMVPASELGQGDAESVGDCDQSVAAAGGVEDHPSGRSCGRCLGDDYGVEALEQESASVELWFAEASSDSETRNSRAIEARVSPPAPEAVMVSPGIAPDCWDQGDALLKQGRGASREMQVECGLGWRDHAQEAGIERGEFVNRGIDKIGHQPKVDRVVDCDSTSPSGQEDRR